MGQLDKRNAALRTLAVDLAYLRKTNDDLIVILFKCLQYFKKQNENDKMNTRISYLQNVDEVHIEIDVLA